MATKSPEYMRNLRARHKRGDFKDERFKFNKEQQIDRRAFDEAYEDEYHDLYENDRDMSRTREAARAFDTEYEANKEFKNFVAEMAKARGDVYSSDREAAAFYKTAQKMGIVKETELARVVQGSKYSDYYEEIGGENGKTYVVQMQREERHDGGGHLASVDKSTTYKIEDNIVEVQSSTYRYGNQRGRGNSRREYRFSTPQEAIAYVDRQISRNKSKFRSGYNEINAQRRQIKKNK